LYWRAETDLAAGRAAQALSELKQFRKTYPDSAIADQALQSLGEAALAANQPADAVTALDAYPSTASRPALLLLRGEAHEAAAQPLDAVADYQALYLRFGLSEQAKQAATKLDFLKSNLGEKFPALTLDQRMAHAAGLFNAKDWRGARGEYAELLPQLSGADHERAELRILECGVSLGGTPTEMNALSLTDPDVLAERFSTAADYYRKQQNDMEMIGAVEAAAAAAPTSRWTEASLFLAGNYYWVQLDRDRASTFYKRVADKFPASSDADAAQWRVTWTAVLKRQDQAAELLQQHLRLFPGSIYTPDALYWLGRLAEDAGVPGLARSYYEKLIERYPQNYFEALGVVRLRQLPSSPSMPADVLASIPPAPVVAKVGATIPVAAARWQARADALKSIGFDASSELELRAAYAATGEAKLLLEAAQAAVDAGHLGSAIATVRQIFPQLESQPLVLVPRTVWTTAYALPYESSIRHWAVNVGIDPMLVAGLIRQESAFEPEARSGANAFGLMQLLPSTAHRLARGAQIHYSQSRLFDPDYNVRLGTLYVAGLQKQFGNIESVLAAYNAGEDRVVSWTSGQTYREPAEFVDSIPFTETRNYVEIVTRNADIYRRLYGVESDSRKTRTRSGH
jgi:soluble lytic murein transglycosylase